MSFTTNEGRVRVDIFKPSGKWYSTASVDMNAFYEAADLHHALLEACEQEAAQRLGEWGLTIKPADLLKDGFSLVCLAPYHKNSHPIMLRGSKTGGGC